MKKDDLLKIFYDEFRIKEIDDYSLNGLQIDCSKDEIRKIVFAVDASLEAIEQARLEKADMLFVHHGFFWGKPLALVKEHYMRIKALLDNDIALFALHLPLDLHPFLGNNAQIAKYLGLENIKPFGLYHGRKIGFKGILETPLTIQDCCKHLDVSPDDDLKILNFGKDKNTSVAIISGGAADDVTQAIDENIDLYITGEHSHITYHTVKENKMNMVSIGHYKSEIFGVRAVCEYVKKLGLESDFIDIPTGC